MRMDAAEWEPEWSASANPAGRVELGRVVAGVLAGEVDRGEARRRLARLAPEASGSRDVTLEALREAVEARTTRRWFADLRASVRAGEPDASARLLQRVAWFVEAEVAELPREAEPGAVRAWGSRALFAALTLAVVAFASGGLWRLAMGAPAGPWFFLAMAVPIGCVFVLHVGSCLGAVAGIVRRQFRCPREPDAVWPFADAAAMEAARNGAAPDPFRLPPARREAGPLPTPSRRMGTLNDWSGVAGVRFVGLETGERCERLWGIGASVYLSGTLVLMLAAPFSAKARVAMLAAFGMIPLAAATLMLAAYARYGSRGLERMRPIHPPRDPLAGGADPTLPSTRADAFLAAYETWFDLLEPGHADKPGEARSLAVADLREVRASPVRVVEVLAMASCLLREPRDFPHAEVGAFIDELREPGLTLAGAAEAFAERFPAEEGSGFAMERVTLYGVALLE